MNQTIINVTDKLFHCHLRYIGASGPYQYLDTKYILAEESELLTAFPLLKKLYKAGKTPILPSNVNAKIFIERKLSVSSNFWKDKKDIHLFYWMDTTK